MHKMLRNLLTLNYQNLTIPIGQLSINNDEYKAYYDNIVIDTAEDVDIEKYNANLVFGRSEFIIKSEDNKMKYSYADFFDIR